MNLASRRVVVVNCVPRQIPHQIAGEERCHFRILLLEDHVAGVGKDVAADLFRWPIKELYEQVNEEFDEAGC